MHKLSSLALGLLLGLGAVGAATAAESPHYSNDPFGDADFAKNAPLVMEVAHPTRGRTEIGLLYTNSVIDKYTYQRGGLIDVTYHITDTIALGGSFGFLHGGLTSIVTDPAGVIGNKLNTCGTDCRNINPNLPDYNQITGVADALFVWSPLYGKINIVSELALNMQIYALAGMGVNGTRQITATKAGQSFNLNNGGFMDGGMFSHAKFHGVGGAGLKIFVTDWMALRTEFRALAFHDTFEFEPGKGKQDYTSAYWFGQGGVSFIF